MALRFHSLYTDAAGHARAQFELAPEQGRPARGEVAFDHRQGLCVIGDTSRALTREEIVLVKRGFRELLENRPDAQRVQGREEEPT